MSDEPLIFAFAGRRILLARSGEGSVLPAAATLDALGAPPSMDVSLGPHAAHALELPDDLEPPPGFVLGGLREAHALLPSRAWMMAGRALQLLEWRRTHRYCGRCGTPTERKGAESAMVCPSCGQLHFPRLSPAVIVLVEREGRALLGRSPHFPPGLFSTLAGFVEPGESLEDAVRREVREEASVEVDRIRYFGSQPWPFPHSLMVAFTAQWAGGEVAPDGVEVEDARWFDPGDLPDRISLEYSIARWLIDDWLERSRG